MRKFIVAALLAVLITFNSNGAGIPVFDSANVAQNIAQVAKQLEEYALQLQQYYNMLLNTLNPALFVWEDVKGIIDSAKRSLSVLQNIRFEWSGGSGGQGGGMGGRPLW